MRHLACVVAFFSLMTACSRDTRREVPVSAPVVGRVLTATSFEEMDGWVTPTPSLTTEKARTGQYALKVDQNTEFSLTYTNPLTHLSPRRFDQVRLTAWGYLTEPGPAALVFQITRPDQTTAFYEKIDISQVGAWAQISKVLTLPPVLDPADQVKVYLWRATATAPAYLDDLTISVEPDQKAPQPAQ
jgi:hypothetical protein